MRPRVHLPGPVCEIVDGLGILQPWPRSATGWPCPSRIPVGKVMVRETPVSAHFMSRDWSTGGPLEEAIAALMEVESLDMHPRSKGFFRPFARLGWRILPTPAFKGK